MLSKGQVLGGVIVVTGIVLLTYRKNAVKAEAKASA